MGEYMKIDGVELKLGTCDGMYYVRRAELEEYRHRARKMEANGELSSYLATDIGLFWRFPFPSEDGQGPREWADRDYQPTSPALWVPDELRDQVTHSSCQQTLAANVGRAPDFDGDRSLGRGGLPSVSLTMPCPMSLVGIKPGGIMHLVGCARPTVILRISSQRWWTSEREYTVFECAYCREPQAFSPDFVQRLSVDPMSCGWDAKEIASRLKGDPQREANA